MKYKSEKTLRRAKKAFSLIELMIVIVIIGALTAIILPQFDVSEAEAKDTGCDASNYGTLSQLSKFRSLNGAYPAKMHTGYEAATSSTGADTLMGGTNTATIPSFTMVNMTDGSGDGAGQSTTLDLAGAEDDGIIASLREAGIVSLACGGFTVDASATVGVQNVAFIGVSSGNALNVSVINYNWFEAWADSDSDGIITSNDNGNVDTTSTPISINGIPLPYYSFEDPHSAFATAAGTLPTISAAGTETEATSGGQDGIVIPLFLAPTTDWEHWYDADGNQNDSKISVAQAGQCPWLEGGAEFRYYIGIFKLYFDGSKAKLLGTMCPEGGSLNP